MLDEDSLTEVSAIVDFELEKAHRIWEAIRKIPRHLYYGSDMKIGNGILPLCSVRSMLRMDWWTKSTFKYEKSLTPKSRLSIPNA